ncbi:hypothetical protein Tco_1074588 [Tanacetum coccineum]
MTVNRLVLEWEEKIKLHYKKEIKHPALVKVENEMDDEGEVTLYLTRRSLEVLRKFHWTTLGGRSNQLSHVSSPLLSKPGEYYFGTIGIHGRKALLWEDKQIPSVEVFSTWMAFGGNTPRGDGVAIIKRRRQDLHRDGVRDPAMASGRGQLKEDLESSMW